MPKIILKFESAVIKELPLTGSVLTIGRKPDNDLAIDHPAVSGHHCRILLQGDIYFIEDLNSTNGTLLGDKKIIKAGLKDQSVIGIAKHTITFIDDRPACRPARADAAAGAPEAVRIPTAPPPPRPSPDATASGTSPNLKRFEKIGALRVTEGAVDQSDFSLTENSTYIGKSDRVAIKIKGLMAPEVAAMIARKSGAYVLVAIKEGYPKVNGLSVDKERSLNEGDVIEVGSTKMQFYLKSA
ncbi:MAG: hypothetical protein A2636_03605 [Elusimicrobia bacterium RIFCSPHIGHO2_01_FULL_64_10]|nr:MAG: hypothetical protein A2636_03605 [Elusimicrobia bacterium RIFCSPHIGHO2_01_FULL_64_10]